MAVLSGRRDDLTFESAYIGTNGQVRVHYARCEPCMWGQHDGGQHGWAGPEDIAHATKTGQPDPTGRPCACYCTKEPHCEPEPPEFEDESLNATPCEVCGESGACDYDAEGRPLIHAQEGNDE